MESAQGVDFPSLPAQTRNNEKRDHAPRVWQAHARSSLKVGIFYYDIDTTIFASTLGRFV